MSRTTTTPRIAGLTVVVALLALLGVACGSSDDSSSSSTTAAASAGIEITDPWIRATPAGATAGAAYMTISSADGDRLTGASVPTDVAGLTEIHETVEAGTDTTMGSESGMDEGMGEMDEGDESMDGMDGMGQMTMRQVSGIDVPAGGSVSLEPGGYHVMLLELAAPLEAGQTVPVTLAFEKAGTVTVDAPVRASAG